MTAFDKKINQIATRHRWNIEKQARAAVPCYIIAAPTYEDGVSRGIVFAADKFLLSYSESRGHTLHVLLSVHVMEFSES